MTDLELLKYMKETAEQIRDLKLHVLKLQNMIQEQSVKNRFLTMRSACEFLHISRATMTKRIAEGEITFAVKKGKSYLFPEEKLSAYASGLS